MGKDNGQRGEIYRLWIVFVVDHRLKSLGTEPPFDLEILRRNVIPNQI